MNARSASQGRNIKQFDMRQEQIYHGHAYKLNFKNDC